MKKYIIFFTIIILFTSCPQIEVDTLGITDFFINNLSDFNILVEYTLTDVSYIQQIILNNELKFLAKVSGDIGIHRKPDEYLKKINIYFEDNTTDIVYSQNPIINANWEHNPPNGYYYWEYAHYTLNIDNEDLNIN